jgi:hypothetical protein
MDGYQSLRAGLGGCQWAIAPVSGLWNARAAATG